MYPAAHGYHVTGLRFRRDRFQPIGLPRSSYLFALAVGRGGLIAELGTQLFSSPLYTHLPAKVAAPSLLAIEISMM
jgi:hypothetical protein